MSDASRAMRASSASWHVEQALTPCREACERRGKARGAAAVATATTALDEALRVARDGSLEALANDGTSTSTSSERLNVRQLDVVVPAIVASMESGSTSVMNAALGATQYLIARGIVAGCARAPPGEVERTESSSDVFNVEEIPANSPSEVAAERSAERAEHDSERHAWDIVDAICGAADVRDEALELQVLKSVLTATSSSTFEVHDRALLRAVRTCYNIYLSSKSEVNQNTAKATLTQMLTTVFHRLERDDPHASAPTIVVADLLRPIGSSTDVDSVTSMSNAVQSFMNKVATDMNSVGSLSYFADPDTAVKSDALEREITDGEFDHDTAPITPVKTATQALEDVSSPITKSCLGNGTSDLELDAFLVFRSLCKLAKKPGSELNGAALVRSKIIALQLLKIIIENAGRAFSSSPRFANVMREYLCDAIVSNSTPNVSEAYQLSCSIFLTLLTRYRGYLKAEIGFFFPMLLLKPLELSEATPLSAYSQRATLVKGFQIICVDAQLMVDLFVNYDCDLDGQNIFERSVSSLVRVAQGIDVSQASGPDAARESLLKAEALECLTTLISALNVWVKAQFNVAEIAARMEATDESEPGTSTLTPLKISNSAEVNLGDSIAKLKADKQEFQHGVSLFNKKAKKGLEYLQSIGRLGKSHEEVAAFLQNTPGLDKAVIGDYLGERDEPMLKVMHAYVDSLDFTGLTLDDAIRKFLEGFRLPGESQKIDRLMEKFAERYHKLNPTIYKSADTAYVLAFSIIMLNTDAHNPQVKNKMTKEGFIRNNRGIDDGQDLPNKVLEDLYDRIVNNEIKLKETVEDTSITAAEKKDKHNFSARLGMDVLFSLMSGKRGEETLHIDTADLISQVRDRAAKTKGFLTVTEVECAKPMLELIWNPILSVLSAAFEDSESVSVVSTCLDCFRCMVSFTASVGMMETRDIFISTLTKFTSLHIPHKMRSKNVVAVKTLVGVAIENGNDLGTAMWTKVMACVSRYEHLYALANGFNDSSLFMDSGFAGEENENVQTRPRLFRRSSMKRSNVGQGPPTDEAGVLTESAQVMAQALEVKLNGGDDMHPPDPAVLAPLHPDELAHLFHVSVNLSGDAIVDFVRSLCELAIEEVSAKHPRAYALSKIVEVASFNMDRIRFIWARVWHVLSDFFVTVGCSPNLQISMTVVDSLRQLAMKFLSRTELANYSFQNEFLRPFVVVMRQSPAVEIRELIIRCVSQMVQARVSHIKSGWKSMFMVFTTAAADEDAQVVSLAFQTIEKIIREHFHYIIESDAVAFTDCVNCLVAFTNSEVGSEVCLNALAFLRFCALKLAEGALGDLEETVASEKQLISDGVVEITPTKSTKATTCFTDADAHTHFWFPLLAGLSELTFDPRTEIRTSALEVLFDTLKFHGSSFAPGFWARVYSRILFPIFDHVRADIVPQVTDGDDDYQVATEDIDSWLFGTCARCLELVVDLAVQFHEPIVEAGILPSLLNLLCSLAEREHEQLAACGVVAFKRLLISGAPLMKEREWHQCMEALKKAFDATDPEFELFLHGEQDPALSRAALTRVKTQILLVSAAHDLCTEGTVTRQNFNVDTLFVLLDVLESVYDKASDASRSLRALDVEVSTSTEEAKALVLTVEVSAASLTLRTLSTLQSDGDSRRTDQLARIVIAALESYSRLDIEGGGDLRECARMYAHVCVEALDAVRALDATNFTKNMPKLYPLLIALVRVEEKPKELSNALCDVFSEHVGPRLEANPTRASATPVDVDA